MILSIVGWLMLIAAVIIGKFAKRYRIASVLALVASVILIASAVIYYVKTF